MKLAILDFGSGNLRSVEQSVRRAAGALADPVAVSVVSDAEAVRQADYIILPGVGHFADCRAGLDRAPGLIEALQEAVRQRGVPFLGICVGLQLMADIGYEGQPTPGFGWLPGEVRALVGGTDSQGQPLKIPHMGWNRLQLQQPDHPVCQAMQKHDMVYFVHSWHLQLANSSDLLASTDYGQPVTAMAGRDTMLGTQFHPEKSQQAGQALLTGFLNWRP